MTQLGAFVGALIAGPMSDIIGRKPTIIIADVLFTFGAGMMAYSWNIESLMAGRLVVGLGVGIASMAVPIYISEVCPKEIRGRVVTVNVLMLTFAQFLSTIISLLCGNNWRLMLGLAGVPSGLQFFGMLGMPESPRWLAKNKK